MQPTKDFKLTFGHNNVDAPCLAVEVGLLITVYGGTGPTPSTNMSDSFSGD